MKESKYYRLIKKTLFSEKASFLGQGNQYIFEVQSSANKIQIKNAIEHIFNVKVDHVNTLKQKGKNVVFRKIKGKKPDWKKAYIKLQQGYSINTGNNN